jgi:hypothetical protein
MGGMSHARFLRVMQATTPRSGRVVDAPGGGSSKLPATLRGAAIIFLFYSFVVATILFLAVWIALK